MTDTQEILLEYAPVVVGVLISLLLIVKLRVFRRGPLDAAPLRRGTVSFLLAAGVFFCYVAAQVFAIQLLVGMRVLVRGNPISPSEHLLLETINAGVELLIVAALIPLMSRCFAGGLRTWGLGLRQLPAGIKYGVTAFITVYPLLIILDQIVEKVLERFGRQIVPHEVFNLLEHLNSPWQVTLSFVSAAVVAPLFEEMFFRGIVQTALLQPLWGVWPARERAAPQGFEVSGQAYGDMAGVPAVSRQTGAGRRWAAILITSAIFAAIHFSPTNFPVLFALAIAMGYVYERTGNLWASMTVHALFNGINLGQFLLNGR